MEPALRVLHIIASFYPATRYGGPTESVLRLCQGLRQSGVDARIVTLDGGGPGFNMDVEHDRYVDWDGVPVRYCRRFPRFEYGISAELVHFLSEEMRAVDLVHSHTLFSFVASFSPLLARLRGVPYIISPRGMALPWGMSQKRWKKKPHWMLLDRPNLARASALHATGPFEVTELSRLAPNIPIIELPNAMQLPACNKEVERQRRRVVYMSRLHPKKGLEVLVEAMSLLTTRLPDVELVMAGPDDSGEWPKTQRRIEAADPKPNVRYLGEVKGGAKTELLLSGAVFALTSHSENFGNVIAEALSCGTPVVVSKNCPWKSVQEEGAGFWVDNTPEKVAEALERVLVRDDGGAMEAAARRLGEQFSPARVGAEMARHYEEICERRVVEGAA